MQLAFLTVMQESGLSPFPHLGGAPRPGFEHRKRRAGIRAAGSRRVRHTRDRNGERGWEAGAGPAPLASRPTPTGAPCSVAPISRSPAQGLEAGGSDVRALSPRDRLLLFCEPRAWAGPWLCLLPSSVQAQSHREGFGFFSEEQGTHEQGVTQLPSIGQDASGCRCPGGSGWGQGREPPSVRDPCQRFASKTHEKHPESHDF